MSDLLTKSGNVKSIIENNYPNPIAVVYRRYLHSDPDDLTGRLQSLINLSEVFIKFLCIVQLQEGRKFIPNFKDRLPDGSKTLEFLRQPSFGHWAGLLRTLSGISLANSKLIWMPKIAEWYSQAKNKENTLALTNLREYQGNKTVPISKKPNAEICDLLPNLRNKFAHGARLTDEKTERRLQLLEDSLTILIKSASFLEEMLVFYVDRFEKAKNDKWLIHAKKLEGASEPAPFRYICQDELELSEVYLSEKVESQLNEDVISLTPFLRWQVNDEEKRFETYFYNDTFRTKLQYLSYASGDDYLHPELHSAFSELIDLKSHPHIDNNEYSSFTEEEREERAENLFNRALIFLQQGRLQNALEYLDQAIVYQRRADIFFTMAEIMFELEEHPDSIKPILLKCLELDPTNSEAQNFLDKLSEPEDEDNESETANYQLKQPSQQNHSVQETNRDQKIKRPEKFTVFHLFCPQPLVGFAIPLWIAFTSLWYMASSLVELSFGNTYQIAAILLMLSCCWLMIFSSVIIRSWVERLRYPLRVQIEGREKDRFDNWYNRQIDLIFGKFCLNHNQTIKIINSIQQEKLFYLGSVIWIAVMTSAAIFFTQSYNLTPLLLLKRIIDYALIFAILYAGARYSIAVTIFVYRFSKLPLKPLLTKINNDGVRSLGPFIAFNIALAALVYFLLHGSFALVYTHPFLGDLLFLCIGTSIVAVWTIAFPFQLRRALQASKSSVVYEYSDHIEKAFKEFIKNPTDENEKWYRHILEKQKIIKDIPVWALSASETVFIIVGSNILLALAAATYAINRLGLWTKISDYFR